MVDVLMVLCSKKIKCLLIENCLLVLSYASVALADFSY